METKHYANEMEFVHYRCKMDGCLVVPPKEVGAGGLTLLWKKEVIK